MSLKRRGRPCIPIDSRLAPLTLSHSLVQSQEKKLKKFGNRTIAQQDPEMPKLVEKRNFNTINSRIKASFRKKELFNEIKTNLERINELTDLSKSNAFKKQSLTIEKSLENLDDRQKRVITFYIKKQYFELEV